MTESGQLLARIRAAGGELVVHEGGLRFLGPAEVLVPELRAELSRYRAELLEQLAGPDVAWRLQAMRKQLRPGQALPFLVARLVAVPARAGLCLSCGDPVAIPDVGRCEPCQLAALITVAEHRRHAANGE